MNGKFLLSAGFLAGTIIGAGVFALPYVVREVGLLAGLFYLFGGAGIYYAVHRMYAGVLVESPRGAQFVTVARRFLSPRAASLASILIFLELIFVLVVYLALAPAFASLIGSFPPTTSLLAFWVVGSLFVFVRLSWQGVAEFLGTLVVTGIVAVVLAAGGDAPLTTPWVKPMNLGLLFLPLGPLLFSFSGRPALHAVVEEWREARERGVPFSLPRAVRWGTFIPVFLYAAFVAGVLRLAPDAAPEGLVNLGALPAWLQAVLGGMGLLTLWTSYFMIGANVKDILLRDLKSPSWVASATVLAVPLLLHLTAFRTFFEALSFTGNIFLGIEGLLVVALWRRAFPSHRLRMLALPVAGVFLAALAYEVVTRFKIL